MFQGSFSLRMASLFFSKARSGGVGKHLSQDLEAQQAKSTGGFKILVGKQ